MLDVVCLLWGDWPHGERYVRALSAAIGEFLPGAGFVCLSDRTIEGIECLPLKTAGWKRNLSKMALYDPDSGLSGRILAFDLDDIPVGPLDALAGYRGRFCCIEDPWNPGKHGGGVASFEAGDPWLAERLYQPCLDDMEEVVSVSGGSERHWLRHALPDADFWPSEWIVDAKPQETMEIIESIPRGTRIAHFHGKPRPHEVRRPWLDSHWNRKDIE